MKKIERSLDRGSQLLLKILAEEYKEMLIKSLLNDDAFTGNIDKRRIIEKDREIKNLINKNKRETKTERYYKILTIVGLIYTIMGAILYVFTNYKFNEFNNNNDLLSMLIMIVGIAVVALSYIMKILKLDFKILKRKKDNRTNTKSEIIETQKYIILDRWVQFENLSRSIAKKLDFQNQDNRISTLIRYLTTNTIIDAKDKEVVTSVLKYRNEIVHGVYLETNNEEVQDLTIGIEKVIEKLEQI
ncbi:hypothetical protein [Clostridium sp.]|jgi:hypothetical protein|uniref:hypothetical protein n=1 Tax=Clostridium sp. TaxID=1506 RepID=UPI003EE9A5A9